MNVLSGVRVPKVCTIRNCEPPMRGGLELDLYRSIGGPPLVGAWCTNGFNVHGSNGWQYTLTAGHCLDVALYTRHVGVAGSWVGAWQPSLTSNFYPTDGAIMPYIVTGGTNYAYYWVVGRPGNTVIDTNRSTLFPIFGSYSYDQIGFGWVACHTGVTSNNTRCGSVVAKDGGVVMDICTKGGDSGGPLFSEIDHRAYGILSWGNNPGNNCFAGVRSGYSPVSKIFATATAQCGIAFDVNTPVPGTVRAQPDLAVRAGPGYAYGVLTRAATGVSGPVDCYATGDTVTGWGGTNNYWDHVTLNGVTGYVADVWLDTGGDIPNQVRRC